MSKSPMSSASDDIDVATLGAALWRAKWRILALTIAVGIAMFVGLSLVRPLYTSEARILIQNNESVFTRPTNDQGGIERRLGLDEQAVQSQVQVLTSRDLILKVVEDLDLTDNAAFAKDAGKPLLQGILERIGLNRGTPNSQDVRAANLLAENLDVVQLSKSSVIAVEYTSGDPQLAADVANEMADVYIGWQRNAKIEQTKDATAWLSAQIDVLRKQVAESEEATEAFRAKKGLFAGSNNVTLNAQQLSELNSQVILAKARKSEAEAKADLIKKLLAENENIDSTPEVLNSTLVSALIQQRADMEYSLADLSATLLPSHPRIRQLKAKIRDVNKQIDSEALKVVKSLENEATIASAREKSLSDSLKKAEEKTAGLGDSEVKLRALEREAKANRDLLESYLGRYRDASARNDMGAVPAQASIISRAHAAVLPSFPKRGPFTLLAMAATALLAVAFVLASALISPPSRTVPPAPGAIRRRRLAKSMLEAAEPAQRTRLKGSTRPTASAEVPARLGSAEPAKPVAPVASAPVAVEPAPAAKRPPAVIPVVPLPPEAPKQPTRTDVKPKTTVPKKPVPKTPVPKTPVRMTPAPKAPAQMPKEKRGTLPALEKSSPPRIASAETPATSGRLDRLRQEYADIATKAAPDPRKIRPARSTGFFNRLCPERAAAIVASAKTTPASKGAEMSSLTSNDLRDYMTQRVAVPDDDEMIGVPQAPQVGVGVVGPVLNSLDAVLDRVLASSAGGLPRALLVAGVSTKADATQVAIRLARALVERDEQVVLVDLAKGASAVSSPLGMPRSPGFSDLAAGQASFADVIRVDEDSPLQVITAGSPKAKSEGPEPDRFMPVFEALTHAYGCVVLHGDLRSVQTLMPALKFELPTMVAVLPAGASLESEKEALATFRALGCPVLAYEAGGKQRRLGLFNRSAAL